MVTVVAGASQLSENLDKGLIILASDIEDAARAHEELQSQEATNKALAFAHEKGMREPMLEDPPRPYAVDKKGKPIVDFNTECGGYRADVRVSARA